MTDDAERPTPSQPHRIATSPAPDPGGEVSRLRTAYLDLMCSSLVGRLNCDPPLQPHMPHYDDAHRLNGWDWPSAAPSMIGHHRMRHLRDECVRVITGAIPGDFLEAGVWRGGAAIMMRAVLHAYGVHDRRVIAADTFDGPPPGDAADAAAFLRDEPAFAVPLETVRAAFHRHGLLDDQVLFLEGRFADTLPDAPVDALAILRLDGDTAESARDTLEALYAKVSPGGSVILDDYYLFEDYRRAIDRFRMEREIADPIIKIDDFGGYWIKDWRSGRRPQ